MAILTAQEVYTKMCDLSIDNLEGKITDAEWSLASYELKREWFAGLHECFASNLSASVHFTLIHFAELAGTQATGEAYYSTVEQSYATLVRTVYQATMELRPTKKA